MTEQKKTRSPGAGVKADDQRQLDAVAVKFEMKLRKVRFLPSQVVRRIIDGGPWKGRA